MSNKTQILFLASLAAFLRPFAQLIYVPSQITLGVEIGTSMALVGLTLSSYALMFALAQIFYGPIVDRFDGKRIMLAGVATFVLASLGGYLGQNIEQFLMLRALQGLGIAAMVIVGVALISDVIPQDERGKAMGVFEISNAAGAAAGPLAGAIVAFWFNWRVDFLVLVLFGIGIGFVAYWRFPQQVRIDQKVGLAEMLAILRTPAPFGSIVLGFVKFYSLFTIFTLLPIYLVENSSFTESQSGVMTSMLPLGAILGSLIGGRAADRFKMRPMLLGGTFALLLAFSALTFLSSNQGSILPIYFLSSSIMIAGLAIGFCLPMQLKLVVDYYPNQRATASGLLIFARFIGATITPVVSGYLADRVGIASGFGLATLLIAIAIFISFFSVYDKD